MTRFVPAQVSRSFSPGRLLGLGSCLVLGAAWACTPSLPVSAVPEEMEFDSEATPPRVPEPSNLIINPLTGKLDFAIAGTPVPADCTTSTVMPEAQCEFLTYLQTLDGYPTSSTPRAPTTAPALIASTLTLGENVVVVNARTGALTTSFRLGSYPVTRYLSVVPGPERKRWTVGTSYWLAVRGYANGVRAASDGATTSAAPGNLVVATPAQFLLKQDTSLTCGATSATELSDPCPAFALLNAPPRTRPQAAQAILDLEKVRTLYATTGAWQRMAAAGLPKSEVAVLWGFPVHSASVAELDPQAGLVPSVVAADEIRVGVQGGVDEATVSAFVVGQQDGPVVVVDLTAIATGDLVAAFPVVSASYHAAGAPDPADPTTPIDIVSGDIVIKAAAPFVSGHQIGIFIKGSITSPSGKPLVPAPVAKLLTLRGTLVGATGHSTVSAVADADAVTLEAGRLQLMPLFDNPTFARLTGVIQDELVYCFAFAFPVLQP